ncbi:hypothetical protein Tco_0211268 [Tanacetum coccineum]
MARIDQLLIMRQTIDFLLFKTINEMTNQSFNSDIFYPEERIKELELRTKRRNNFEEELFKNSFPPEKELAYHKELLGEPQPAFSTLEPKISFAYECDFMILEDTTRIIDHHLSEMVFRRPFIEETRLVYNKGEGTVMFEQNDAKITFKMPHIMEIFKQAKLMGLSTDFVPPFAHEENFSHERNL